MNVRRTVRTPYNVQTEPRTTYVRRPVPSRPVSTQLSDHKPNPVHPKNQLSTLHQRRLANAPERVEVPRADPSQP